MIGVVASCVIGTDPCDDSGSVAVGVPWWLVAGAVVVVVALIVAFIALLVRVDRRRPWD